MQKRMIGKLILYGTIIAVLGMGCGTQGNTGNDSKVENVEDIQENDAGQSDRIDEGTQTEGMASDSKPVQTDRQLTIEELKQFMQYINRWDNYGFLLSEYESPEYVDLDQVFYSGAGIEREELSEEERAVYEALAGEIYTEMFRLTTLQINEFLQIKAGITLAEMKTEFGWMYMDEYDCYVCQCGDTNYTSFTCTGGVEREQGVFEIRCAADNDYVDDCVVTLKMQEDGTYHFVSNRYEENTDDRMAVYKIEDQSFEIELESWGSVSFASYEPNTKVNQYADATFSLLQNGERIYVFPEVHNNNEMANAIFTGIPAVAFKDYDKDGYTDVIIICQYEPISGPDAAQGYNEVRIYKGNEKSFVYMDSLSLSLNTDGNNETIAGILEAIELEPLDLSDMDEKLRKQLETFVKYRTDWLDTEWEPQMGQFAIEDLDGDGRLELIVWTMGGTGRFSDNFFYQAKEDGSGVTVLPLAGEETAGQWDLGVNNEEIQVLWDAASQRKYYLVADYFNAGIFSSYRADGYLYLSDGAIYDGTIRGNMRNYGEDVTVIEEFYYDAAGNEISKEQWEQLYTDFVSGKEVLNEGLKWSEMNYAEAVAASDEALLRMLAETMNGKP